MKKILVVMLLALMMFGCKEKKKVYYESDVIEEEARSDVDYIALYLRCHELDSIKDLAVKAAAASGKPFEALPDSVNQKWNGLIGLILNRKGEQAFEFYDANRVDFARYLRADFINYGFITRVYLPYKATVSSREEYGEICIAELEKEFVRIQQGLMMGQGIPSHYESLLNELYYAYMNYGRYEEAAGMCDQMLAFAQVAHGEKSPESAAVLAKKADMLQKGGSSYSATVAAKQALQIYDACLSSPAVKEADAQQISEAKSALEAKLKEWQGK